MGLIQLVVVLLVVGIGLWLINAYIPMAKPIKTILNVVIIVAVVLYVLYGFGVLDTVPRFRI